MGWGGGPGGGPGGGGPGGPGGGFGGGFGMGGPGGPPPPRGMGGWGRGAEGCCLGPATCCGPGLLLVVPGMLFLALRHPVRAARRLRGEMDSARDADQGGR